MYSRSRNESGRTFLKNMNVQIILTGRRIVEQGLNQSQRAHARTAILPRTKSLIPSPLDYCRATRVFTVCRRLVH
jgi:hypothetical protein